MGKFESMEAHYLEEEFGGQSELEQHVADLEVTVLALGEELNAIKLELQKYQDKYGVLE